MYRIYSDRINLNTNNDTTFRNTLSLGSTMFANKLSVSVLYTDAVTNSNSNPVPLVGSTLVVGSSTSVNGPLFGSSAVSISGLLIGTSGLSLSGTLFGSSDVSVSGTSYLGAISASQYYNYPDQRFTGSLNGNLSVSGITFVPYISIGSSNLVPNVFDGILNQNISISESGYLTKQLSVQGVAFFGNHISVSGSIYANNVAVNSENAFNGMLDSSLSITGTTYLKDALSVNGTVYTNSIQGRLVNNGMDPSAYVLNIGNQDGPNIINIGQSGDIINIGGTKTIINTTEVNLSVSGILYHSSALSVAGTLFGASSVSVGGTLFGASSLSVGGTLFGASSVSVGGPLVGASSVSVGGPLVGASSVSVGGPLIGASSVSVGGPLIGASSVSVGGPLIGASSLSVSGLLYSNGIVAPRIQSTLSVQGPSFFNDTVYIPFLSVGSSNLSVSSGGSSFNGTLQGALSVSNSIYTGGSVYANGLVKSFSLDTTSMVTSTIQANNGYFYSSIQTPNAYINGDTFNAGTVSINGPTFATSLSLSTNLHVGGDLTTRSIYQSGEQYTASETDIGGLNTIYQLNPTSSIVRITTDLVAVHGIQSPTTTTLSGKQLHKEFTLLNQSNTPIIIKHQSTYSLVPASNRIDTLNPQGDDIVIPIGGNIHFVYDTINLRWRVQSFLEDTPYSDSIPTKTFTVSSQPGPISTKLFDFMSTPIFYEYAKTIGWLYMNNSSTSERRSNYMEINMARLAKGTTYTTNMETSGDDASILRMSSSYYDVFLYYPDGTPILTPSYYKYYTLCHSSNYKRWDILSPSGSILRSISNKLLEFDDNVIKSINLSKYYSGKIIGYMNHDTEASYYVEIYFAKSSNGNYLTFTKTLGDSAVGFTVGSGTSTTITLVVPAIGYTLSYIVLAGEESTNTWRSLTASGISDVRCTTQTLTELSTVISSHSEFASGKLLGYVNLQDAVNNNPSRSFMVEGFISRGHNSLGEVVYEFSYITAGDDPSAVSLKMTPGGMIVLTLSGSGASDYIHPGSQSYIQFYVFGITTHGKYLETSDERNNLGRVAQLDRTIISANRPYQYIDSATNADVMSVRTAGTTIRSTLSVAGSIYTDTNVFVGGATVLTSDARVKTNIHDADLDICYQATQQIPLRRFQWDQEKTGDLFQDQTVLGVVAQEYEQLFPKSTYVVPGRFGIEDFKMIDPMQIMWTMLGAVKKLQQKNNDLEERLRRLESPSN